MSYIDDIPLFRDMNKNPDVYNLPLDKATKESIQGEKPADLKSIERRESKKKIEKLGPLAANYREVIEALTDIRLKPEFSSHDPENKVLAERRKIVLGFLRQILDDVQRYVTVVNSFNIIYNSQNDTKDSEEYASNLKNVDSERRIIHNRLISDLKIFVRLVNINFNADFDFNSRFGAERQMPDRKNLSDSELREALNKRDYIKFDQKNFLLGDLPTNSSLEREAIKEWAFGLYGDLANLDDDLKEALQNKDPN
ncbi:hypothetical protein COT98_04090 [Candidatus Falkowbacteria bacterium CG10_big_fil_rev_8_21_14_0_10_39_9]|uniref:Uncharacterized protein n=1 Tax=Candidatus Falkowbacteria bacterium CG10_big_fil_rev_8_21_14_0_10_39_9 TaxID=1974566 RepID=A0A2M6WNH2_9BACT|nr:MAG: hypothetical protein COT98_04090 [Candidatus Falkowbacteria bacterium CG10_big_fil_rev_8_21_14_0_10_39_9]